MAIDPERLRYQIITADAWHGEPITYDMIKPADQLRKAVQIHVIEHGTEVVEEGKKLRRAHFKKNNYVWRATDSGDNSNILIEGYYFHYFPNDMDKAVPIKLKTLKLPGELDYQRLLEVAAENGDFSLRYTTQQISAATKANPTLFNLAQAQEVLDHTDVSYFSLPR